MSTFNLYDEDRIATKAEREELMHDIDPGDAAAERPATFNGDEWVNQHNQEAWEFSVRGFKAIKRSFKYDILQCYKNKDYDKLVDIIKEINDLIIYDQHAWGNYLPPKLFKWVTKYNQ